MSATRWTASLPVSLVPPIERVPVQRGYRCLMCNVADLTLASLRRNHSRYKAGSCRNATFAEANVQRLNFGTRFVCFGVIGEEQFDDGLTLTVEEFEAAERAFRELEAMRNGENDDDGNTELEVGVVESHLYQQLGWFRLNADRTDYTDVPRAVIVAIGNYAIEQEHLEKLFNFFKACMREVHNIPFDVLQLLADTRRRTIRPIQDQHDSYPRFFVAMFRFIFATVDGGFRLAESRRMLLVPLVNQLKLALRREGQLGFDDVAPIWEMMVEQRLGAGMEIDLIFMAIRSLCVDNRSGQLEKAGVVEQMAAKAFYFCRLFMLMRLQNSTEEDFDDNARLAEAYFRGNNTPFNRLCVLKGLAHQISEAEDIIPVIHSVTDVTHIWIGTLEIRPQTLMDIFSGLSASFEVLLNQLLFGFAVDYDNFQVVDDPANNSVGSLMRCTNPSAERFLVHRFFQRGSRVRDQFFQADGQLNEQAVNRYIALHDNSCRTLCPLIHLCSGMPARATEINDLRFSTGVSLRNIYFAGNQVMIVTRRNKTNVLTGINKVITRFLPVQLSKRVAVWLIVVRPLYQMLARVKYGNDIAMRARRFVFVKNGECFSPELVRECFKVASNEHGGREIKFSQYRHIAKHYAKNVLMLDGRFIPDEEDEDGEMDLIEDRQFGHTTRTANVRYGRNVTEAAGLNRNYIVEDFRSMSARWHGFLQFGVVNIGGRANGGAGGAGVGGEQNVVPLAVEREEALRQAVLMRVNPAVLTGRRPATGENEPEEIFIDRSQYLQMETLLETCLNLTGFKSSEQRWCSALCLFTEVDLLTIIPTGGGKSLIFILEALWQRRSGNKTLVIVPTKSLQKQTCWTFGDIGLHVSTRIRDTTANCYVLTPEAFILDDNQAVIRQYIIDGILKRIFVDEAQCLFRDSSYRVGLARMLHLRYLDVPLTFLSGSLPLSMSDGLVDMFKRSNRAFKVVRASTNRPNIRYSVKIGGSIRDLDAEIGRYLADDRGGRGKCIVYVYSRGQINRVYQRSNYSFIMTRYSSEFTDGENEASVEDWLTGRTPVMVATSGFGLGIDCADVRLVVCFGKPYCLEDMVQQFGRAGRDGERSSAILMTLPEYDNRYTTAEVNRYSENSQYCRRLLISSAMDSFPVDCGAGYFVECDICSRDTITIPRYEPRPVQPGPPLMTPSPSGTSLDAGTSLAGTPTPIDDYSGFELFAGDARAQNPALTAEGQVQMRLRQNLESELLICLRAVVGKCLFCLFIDCIVVEHEGACTVHGHRCFRCTRDDHIASERDDSVCPVWNVDASIEYHYMCGLEREVCGDPYAVRCEFTDILPVFYRSRTEPGGEIRTLGIPELEALYLEFVLHVRIALDLTRNR